MENEICECGHAKMNHNETITKGYPCYHKNCLCHQFTARPDEGDERKIDAEFEAERKRRDDLTQAYREGWRDASECLKSQLAAERTRREEAEAIIDFVCNVSGLRDIERLALQYRAKYPAQDSTRRRDESTEPKGT